MFSASKKAFHNTIKNVIFFFPKFEFGFWVIIEHATNLYIYIYIYIIKKKRIIYKVKVRFKPTGMPCLYMLHKLKTYRVSSSLLIIITSLYISSPLMDSDYYYFVTVSPSNHVLRTGSSSESLFCATSINAPTFCLSFNR